MSYSDYTAEAVADRGKAIYQRLRDVVEPAHNGKFLVIDIETENYEIDAQGTVAVNRLLSKHPDAVIYLLRIGHRTAYRIGFRGAYGTLTNKSKTNTKLLQ